MIGISVFKCLCGASEVVIMLCRKKSLMYNYIFFKVFVVVFFLVFISSITTPQVERKW